MELLSILIISFILQLKDARMMQNVSREIVYFINKNIKSFYIIDYQYIKIMFYDGIVTVGQKHQQNKMLIKIALFSKFVFDFSI